MSIAEKLTSVAENQQKVYDAGKQAEYDRFWDKFQQNGNRTDYAFAFAGAGWNSETLKPKYPVTPTYCFEMFRSCRKIDITNVGVDFDFSKSTSFSNFAHSSAILHFGVVDTTSATGLSYTFYNCSWLTTIDKLILKSDGSQTMGGNYTFYNCDSLKNIVIEGVIGSNISFRWSPLTKASIESVMAALSDTASGCSVAFSKAAVNTAFETAEGLEDGSASDAWQALVATKDNWTVSLV